MLWRLVVLIDLNSVEASVREDMAIIKADPFLPKDLEVSLLDQRSFVR